MKKNRPNYIQLSFILILLVCSGTLQSQEPFLSPVDFRIYLSGNFGELRANHFHSGIDIKTQGAVGKAVHAVERGYVSRISISPWGYGYGLYITHPNGRTTVLGHLQRYSSKIEAFAHKLQYAKESFIIDETLKPSDLPVDEGEVVAWSGNSGASAGPHLHFEVRDTQTEELYNPFLYLHQEITDTQAPRVNEVMICPMPGKGGVNNADRRVILKATSATDGHQRLTGQIRAWGEIGIALHAEDFMNGSSSRLGVKEITLLLDNKQIFHSDMDHYFIPETRYINSFTDFEYYKHNGKAFIRSYTEPGNKLRCITTDSNRGILRITEEKDYHLTYRLSDYFGNSTELTFVISGRKQPIEPIDYSGTSLMHWNVNTDFKARNAHLNIPSGYLYDDLHFIYKEKDNPDGPASTFTLHNRFTPLHGYCKLSLRLSHDTLQKKNQYGIVYFRGSNAAWVGGAYDNGWITGSIRELGDYSVRIDSKAPTIAPIAPNNWMRSRKIRLQLSDNMSGIQGFKTLLDGRFILFEMDKRSVISCTVSRSEFGSGRHTLVVKAWDQCGNQSSYTTTLNL